MSDDSLARTPSAASAASARAAAEYDAIHETIAATERGRWFLDEHARRYRGADTERVLAAIARIEQALRGARALEPESSIPDEFAAISETIAQARSDIIGRYGDPAASGEAAIADFRNAAEQIQELILAAHGRDSELGAQLSFQTNRLASAGERFERCVTGLRALLGLVERIDQRLREPGRDSETQAVDAPRRSAAAVETKSLIKWNLPTADAAHETQSEPDPRYIAQTTPIRVEAEQRAPQPDFGNAAVFWEMTAAQPEADRDEAEASEPPEDATSEAGITDWAFAPADADAGSAAIVDRSLSSLDAADVSEHPPADQPPADEAASGLERLEAREYGRQRVAAADPAPSTDKGSPVSGETPAASQHGDWDDLVLGPSAVDEDGAGAPAPEPASLSWTIEPAAAAGDPEPAAAEWANEQPVGTATAGPLLDSDLFEGEDSDDAVLANPDHPASLTEAGLGATDASLGGMDIEDRPPEDTWRSHAPAFLDRMTADPIPDAAPTAGQDEPVRDQRYAAWETRLPPLPTWPDRETAASQASGPEDAGADVQTVLQRLETVRTAIAALMDEVNEKTARRNPPQS